MEREEANLFLCVLEVLMESEVITAPFLRMGRNRRSIPQLCSSEGKEVVERTVHVHCLLHRLAVRAVVHEGIPSKIQTDSARTDSACMQRQAGRSTQRSRGTAVGNGRFSLLLLGCIDTRKPSGYASKRQGLTAWGRRTVGAEEPTTGTNRSTSTNWHVLHTQRHRGNSYIYS